MRGLEPQIYDVLLSLQGATRTVAEITRRCSRHDMSTDVMVQLAVTKAVEWVGEISGRLLKKWPDFAANHPELELAAAYRARNRLSHGYDTVDFDLVWEMATVQIPKMEATVSAIIANLDDRP